MDLNIFLFILGIAPETVGHVFIGIIYNVLPELHMLLKNNPTRFV